jgi:hypothetical protein
MMLPPSIARCRVGAHAIVARVTRAFGRPDAVGGRSDNDNAHYANDGAPGIDRGAAIAHVRALAQPVRDRRRLLGRLLACSLTWRLAGSGSPSESAASKPGGGGKSLADCMGFWDAATHMSKVEWRAACKRSMAEFPDVKW